MDTPTRLLDEDATPLERALLLEGRAYHGPSDLRAHTLAALGISGAAGVATSVGIAGWFLSKSWATKLVLVLSAATALVAVPVAYLVLRSHPASTRPAPMPSPTVATTPAPPPPAPVPALEPPVAPAPPAAQVAAPASAPRAGSSSSGSALRAELAALDTVRSTLAHDPAGALSFLDAYFRTFPRGHLHLEAEVLRIDALAKAGRTDQARKSATEFLHRHPNSVLAPRVQAWAGPASAPR